MRLIRGRKRRTGLSSISQAPLCDGGNESRRDHRSCPRAPLKRPSTAARSPAVRCQAFLEQPKQLSRRLAPHVGPRLNLDQRETDELDDPGMRRAFSARRACAGKRRVGLSASMLKGSSRRMTGPRSWLSTRLTASRITSTLVPNSAAIFVMVAPLAAAGISSVADLLVVFACDTDTAPPVWIKAPETMESPFGTVSAGVCPLRTMRRVRSV